jgi:hypothetical protein
MKTGDPTETLQSPRHDCSQLYPHVSKDKSTKDCFNLIQVYAVGFVIHFSDLKEESQ